MSKAMQESKLSRLRRCGTQATGNGKNAMCGPDVEMPAIAGDDLLHAAEADAGAEIAVLAREVVCTPGPQALRIVIVVDGYGKPRADFLRRHPDPAHTMRQRLHGLAGIGQQAVKKRAEIDARKKSGCRRLQPQVEAMPPPPPSGAVHTPERSC